MKRTSYNIEKIYNTYKEILEAWKLPSNFPTINECIGFKKELIEEHNNIFTNIHCSQAQHYLNNVKKINKHQYINNACKYFLYWLYFEVLKKNLDNHKILNVYKDVLTAYTEGSGKENFRNYINFFSEEIMKKIIKLTEMYDYFYKFKGNTQHGDNKCIHANECVRLYNENIKICETGNDYDFCYELDNLKKRYDKYMMSNNDCPHLPKILKSYSVQNTAVVIITPFSILLVISLSLFFLYKYTPFGSIIRKRTKNKKKISGNLDYATHVLPHTSQRLNNYNNNRQYNISYLSSGQ